MKVGAERLPDITFTFLSPFSHMLHHHLEPEVAPLWFIPNSTYIQTMCPHKRRSRMPCEQIASKERIVKFDTDAKPIRVDNRCSACISPYVKDFIGPLEDTNKTTKGFAGAQTNNSKTGTLHWQWLDDQGRMHTFEILNSYYVPECEQQLLSPQHWAQTRSAANRATTYCITSAVNVYLRWTKGDESYELTLPLNKRGSNMGTLFSHPGNNKYDLFCQAADIKITDDKDPIAVLAHLISDDEDKEENHIQPQIGPLPPSLSQRVITCPRLLHYHHHLKTMSLSCSMRTCVNFTSAWSQRELQHQNYLQSSKMTTPQWLSMKKTSKKALQKRNY